MCSSTHAEHAERAEGEAMPKRKDLSKEIELLFELIEDISAVRDDAQQANAELQNVLQEQQQLRGRISELRGTLDGMNKMSEMTSLRLEMTIDRRSKFIETLSNLMKKTATTADELAQNIK